jgi:glycine hydroxymethyltransferase
VSTGLVDYDALESSADLYRPKIIVGGASAYPRSWDLKRLRAICDKFNSYFLFDMAHISGLVAAGVVESPFEFADVVTTTTHKSLRGPRGAMIFYRRGQRSVDKKGNGKVSWVNVQRSCTIWRSRLISRCFLDIKVC